jgi:hypothetical protein
MTQSYAWKELSVGNIEINTNDYHIAPSSEPVLQPKNRAG